MTKSFSPAGMAIKGYFGRGARTFGNPDGATKGGGAYAAGGNNPNGPNQGGGGAPPLVLHQRSATALDQVTHGGGLWVALDGAATSHSYTSLDGKTWTLAGTFPANDEMTAIGFGGSPQVFCAQGVNIPLAQVVSFTSTNGSVWTPGTVPTSNVQPSGGGVAFGNGLVLSGGTSHNLFVSSDNGNTFVNGTAFGTLGNGAIIFDGTNFVFSCSANTGCPGPPAVGFTPDGSSVISVATATELNAFAFINGLAFNGSLYVAVDSRGEISTSTSSNWVGTLRATFAGVNWTGVAFGGGVFVACGLTGTDAVYTTSSDGITWATPTVVAAGNFFGIFYGSPFFVLVGDIGIWTLGPASAG